MLSSETRAVLPVLIGLVGSAWLALAVWGASPAAYLLDHGNLEHAAPSLEPSTLLLAGGFAAGWCLMVVAMMLPTILPLLGLVRVSAGPALARSAAFWCAAGYIVVWFGFGLVVHAADFGLHEIVSSHRWLHANTWVLGAAPLIVTGAYQFSPLKHVCLDRCRSPFSFVAARWKGGRPLHQSFRIGIEHGGFCLGCCWALMLLMFAVSVGSLAWMLLLAVVMGAEKNLAFGHQLTTPIGVVLLSGGATIVALNV